jgi:hypothetical protein
VIHGVDSYKLLTEINRQAAKAGRTVNCLLQLHIAQEESKFGFSFDECRDISVTIKESPGRILSNTPDNLRSLLLTLPLTVSVYHLSMLIPFLSAKRTISSRWFSKNCFSVLTLK